LWKERRAFLKEDDNERRLKEESHRGGYRKESPVDHALYVVYESVGDAVSYYNGVLSCEPESIARVRTRAGKDPNQHAAYGYVDRGGKLHLPFGDAVDLARAFCAAEPSTVLAQVEGTEREWAHQARIPGEEHMVGLLNEYRAAWALIRQWAGHDAALAQRDAEIQRVERLVWDAIKPFRRPGWTTRPPASGARWRSATPRLEQPGCSRHDIPSAYLALAIAWSIPVKFFL
jgi:hypothetical protein